MSILTDILSALEALSVGLAYIPLVLWAVLLLAYTGASVFCMVIVPRRVRHYRDRFKIIRLTSRIMLGVLAVLLLLLSVMDRSSAQLLTGGNRFYPLLRTAADCLVMLPLGVLSFNSFSHKHRLAISIAIGGVAAVWMTLMQLLFSGGITVCLLLLECGKLLLQLLFVLIGVGIVRVWKKGSHQKKKSRKRRLYHALALFLAFCFLLPSLAFAVFHTLRCVGAESLLNLSHTEVAMEQREEEDMYAADENYDPNLIWYKGNGYRYNDAVTTILFMGVDRNGDLVNDETAFGQSGQADSIFLMVLDNAAKTARLIAVSRDTITPIPVYDFAGDLIGKQDNHLAIAYAMGDGRETSCQYMVDSVSNLFYGMPIHGYAAFNMDAIEYLTNAVGGVPITFQEDMTFISGDFVKGTTQLLKGQQAVSYLRHRAHEGLSNDKRIVRQKTYLMSFYHRALSALKQTPTLPATIYQELSNDGRFLSSFDISEAVYLATNAAGYRFDENALYTVAGKSVSGPIYDEFYVDDTALYELILDTFYVKAVSAIDPTAPAEESDASAEESVLEEPVS